MTFLEKKFPGSAPYHRIYLSFQKRLSISKIEKLTTLPTTQKVFTWTGKS